jgi:hypothetical protein
MFRNTILTCLPQLFPKASPQALDLLEKLLTFSPRRVGYLSYGIPRFWVQCRPAFSFPVRHLLPSPLLLVLLFSISLPVLYFPTVLLILLFLSTLYLTSYLTSPTSFPQRIEVEEALAHPYLASYHDPADEPVAADLPEGFFDFEYGMSGSFLPSFSPAFASPSFIHPFSRWTYLSTLLCPPFSLLLSPPFFRSLCAVDLNLDSD